MLESPMLLHTIRPDPLHAEWTALHRLAIPGALDLWQLSRYDIGRSCCTTGVGLGGFGRRS